MYSTEEFEEYLQGFKRGWYDYFSGEEFPPDNDSPWMKGYHAGWKQGLDDEESLKAAETLTLEYVNYTGRSL